MKKIITYTALGIIIICLSFLYNYKINEYYKIFYPTEHFELVEQYAAELKISPNLIYAVMKTESGFKENAKSGAGAMGLMQITRDTFNFIKEKSKMEGTLDQIYDPKVNIYCGAWFLNYLLERYNGNLVTTLCAYNAGMGNVKKWLANDEYSSDGVNIEKIPYNETRNYVARVTQAYEKYEKLYGVRGE